MCLPSEFNAYACRDQAGQRRVPLPGVITRTTLLATSVSMAAVRGTWGGRPWVSPAIVSCPRISRPWSLVERRRNRVSAQIWQCRFRAVVVKEWLGRNPAARATGHYPQAQHQHAICRGFRDGSGDRHVAAVAAAVGRCHIAVDLQIVVSSD